MKDLQLHILFWSEIILGFTILFGLIIRFYLLQRQKKAVNIYLNLLKNKDTPMFFSTNAVRRFVTHKFFHLPLKPEINNALCAIKNLPRALDKSIQEIRLSTVSPDYKLLLAQLYFANNDLISGRHLLEQTTLPFYCSQLQKAVYHYLTAGINFYSTDMDKASRECNQALKIFKRYGCPYEQAECYLIMAQIYRLSGFLDISFTMLKEAEKIYKLLNLKSKIAEMKAYIGILEINRENYEVALEYFSDAQKLCPVAKFPQLNANINNWKGLIHYLQGNLSLAEKCYKSVVKYSKFSSTLSLAQEMLARIALQNNNFQSALKYTDKSLKLNQAHHNNAGIFEILYLQAEIYFARNEYDKSSEILTELISRPTPAKTTYYPANAYTLLGLISLKRNNLNKATTYFKQAIDLENSRDRIKGAAVDYNNLAETALRQGHLPEAEKYLNLALSYAETLNDEELSNYIKNKLSAHKTV